MYVTFNAAYDSDVHLWCESNADMFPGECIFIVYTIIRSEKVMTPPYHTCTGCLTLFH